MRIKPEHLNRLLGYPRNLGEVDTLTRFVLRNGVELWADPNEEVGRCIQRLGIYDLSLSEALVRLIDPRDTIADIGANIGYCTSLCSAFSHPGNTIHSFEPGINAQAVLKKNIQIAAEKLRHCPIVFHSTALDSQDAEA